MYEDDHDDDHFDESEEAEDEESEEAEDEESSDDNNDNDSDEEHEDESDESNGKPSIKNRLREVLKIFETVGATEFAISGALSDAPLNLISIKRNKKIIRFPLFEEDLPLIIDAFKQSPYGKGTETIVDASFRNSWHLEPDDFEIMNPKWNSYVNDVLVARIRQEMALTTTFKASLYRLLLYKSGSFFKPHRDTEKEEGMFATLVVQLPSRFDGGQLVIEHDNITKKIDFNSNMEVPGHMYTTFFSAFYCDCKHEILTVTDGIRVCLVYNLVMTATNTSQELPIAPMVSGIEMKMANVCNEWRNTNGPPVKIVYGLSHKYTERSLSLKNLKSTDKSVADALIKFSKDHSLVVCLGTLEKTWQGDEAFLDDKYAEEEVEIDYSLKHLEMIGHPHIGIPKVSGMSMDQDELISKDCFRHVTPFDEQREETGNEGTTLTLSYRHSALVVFPIENAFAILMKKTKRGEAVRMFIDNCKQLESAGGKDDTKKKQLLRWANVLIQKSSWPNEEISLEFLSALSTLNDLPLLQKYVENYILNEESIDPVVALCDTYGWNVFGQHLMTGLKKLNHQKTLEVLDALVGKKADFVGKVEKKKFCLTLMDLIPSWKVDTFSYGYGYGRRYLKVEFVHKFCDLATRLRMDPKKHLAALPFEIDETSIESVIKLCDTYGWDILSEQLVNGFKKLPQETALKVMDALVGSQADFVGKDEKKKVCLTLVDLFLKASKDRNPSGEFLYKFCVLAQRIDYDPTAHLTVQRFETMIPVLVKIASTTKKVLEQRWRATAQHFLSQVQELANSVNQTPVWIRSEHVPCECEDCVVLSAFIRANQKTTDFKVIKKRRLHLEKIVNGIANLTFTTESSGRPQKMTVAKTVPSSHAASQQQNVARTLMPKLTSILR